jgi:hypothetical protein
MIITNATITASKLTNQMDYDMIFQEAAYYRRQSCT